jgi:hypothetical protein
MKGRTLFDIPVKDPTRGLPQIHILNISKKPLRRQKPWPIQLQTRESIRNMLCFPEELFVFTRNKLPESL